MEFNFTNTTDQGYSVLPPGKYPVVTKEWWLRKKEFTGNMVIDLDVEVVDGEYQGETSRYFHAITSHESSKGFLYRLLRNLGVFTDADRGPNEELLVAFVYGEEDEKGRVQIVSIEVNGEEREVEGLESVAIVTPRQNPNTGEKTTGIYKFELPGTTAKQDPLIEGKEVAAGDDPNQEQSEKPNKQAAPKAAPKKGNKRKVPF